MYSLRSAPFRWPEVPCLLYPSGYNEFTFAFFRTDEFDAWLSGLKDARGRARIVHRIVSPQHGNFGDRQPVGEGVSEMRVTSAPATECTFTRIGGAVYWLLVGGDKSSQKRDIKRALDMARELGKE